MERFFGEDTLPVEVVRAESPNLKSSLARSYTDKGLCNAGIQGLRVKNRKSFDAGSEAGQERDRTLDRSRRTRATTSILSML